MTKLILSLTKYLNLRLTVNKYGSSLICKPIFKGRHLDLYLKIFKDLGYMLTGSDKAIYKQEVGPYSWQEEGRYKLWNHLGGIFGLSGKNFKAFS
jgi:hypothetical protein